MSPSGNGSWERRSLPDLGEADKLLLLSSSFCLTRCRSERNVGGHCSSSESDSTSSSSSESESLTTTDSDDEGGDTEGDDSDEEDEEESDEQEGKEQDKCVVYRKTLCLQFGESTRQNCHEMQHYTALGTEEAEV